MTDPRPTPVRFARVLRPGVGWLCLLLLAAPVSAQDLDPRAYAHVPVNGTFLVTGFALSHGGIVTDPALVVTDVNATVETPSLGVARSFSLFGKTAQIFGALPYSWAQASGKVLEEAKSITRAGLSDTRLRFSVLVRGAPAASVLEIAKAPRRTILGTSLMVVAPTGQFFPDRLINLGTNRWGFKPEFAVSHPIGQRWLLDTYAGLWLFTGNDSLLSRAPPFARRPHGHVPGARQLQHSSARCGRPSMRPTTSEAGSTVDGVSNDDRQSNTRVGATFAFPVGRRHSIKLAVSRGAIVRVGADFSTFSFGWQTAWVPRPAPAR